MSWQQTPTGYRSSDGRAELIKRVVGKRTLWTLIKADGTRHELGAKASFSSAEKLLK